MYFWLFTDSNYEIDDIVPIYQKYEDFTHIGYDTFTAWLLVDRRILSVWGKLIHPSVRWNRNNVMTPLLIN